jgi:DNA-binding MarR family transcriptional regulator
MAGKLAKEIHQTRPFSSVEQEVFLNVLRTADVLTTKLDAILKPLGLSPTQYNVLRILRGAGEDGLACGRIAERMITRDPDVTRLLDRLEKCGLIRRARQTDDRRVVKGFITPAGIKLLADLDAPVKKFNKQQLAPLGPAKLRQLADLLEAAREEP